MDQELANCNKAYDKITYSRRQICVTIKTYIVIKLSYNQIWLIKAKEKGAIKQVAYVNYTLNQFKELYQSLKNFLFIESSNVQ